MVATIKSVVKKLDWPTMADLRPLTCHSDFFYQLVNLC